MKKIIAFFTAFCCMIASIPLSACAAQTNYSNTEIIETLENSASAAILDADGNILSDLDVNVTLEEISGNRSTGTTYTATFTADGTKADADATYLDGVTATITITWNDIAGITNSLVKVEGSWTLGTKEITDLYASYAAKDIDGNVLTSDSDNPASNPFLFEPKNCTGFKFTAHSRATIVESGKTITLNVATSATT